MSLGHEDNVIDRISDGHIPSSTKISDLERLQQEKLEVITENSRNYLNEVLKLNATKSVRLQSLNLIGGDHFRESFLIRQLQPLLNNDKLTLEKFLYNIDEVKDNFLKNEAIQNMGLQIDKSYFKANGAPFTSLDLVSNLQIIPSKKYFLKIGTNVGNGEGDGYLTLKYKNIFGGSESLTLDTTIASNSLSTKNKSTYLLNFSLPLNNSPNWRLDNIAFQSSRYIDFMCNHEQVIRGFNNKLSSQFTSNWNHEFSVENVLRSINLMANNTYLVNDDILFQSGDSLKSCFTYQLSYDNRDDKLLPTSGVLFKNSIEYSVLSPFIKTNLEFQIANKISPYNFINFSFRSGYIHNMTSSPLHIMDRFYLGGPNDLRGYELNGLGPKLMRSPIGGNLFFGANLSHFTNLGKYDSFKLQNFINLGNIVNVDNLMDPNSAKLLFSEPSISAGIGLVYKHPIARFELNFVLPIVSHHYDSTRKGLQYGIGLSFM